MQLLCNVCISRATVKTNGNLPLEEKKKTDKKHFCKQLQTFFSYSQFHYLLMPTVNFGLWMLKGKQEPVLH